MDSSNASGAACACARLTSDASETRARDIGPCFSLGEPKETPRGADPRTWLSLIGTSNEARTIDPYEASQNGGAK